MLKDFDIRKLLRARLQAEHAQEPNTLIIDELAVCDGVARVDIAVVNGRMSGYEIKSDHDTFRRLPNQQEMYGRCFDVMNIVVGPKHLANAIEAVPPWWGIYTIEEGESGPFLKLIRSAKTNNNVRDDVLVRLLWRDELLSIAADQGLDAPKRASRLKLWSIVSNGIPSDRLRHAVRESVKARGDWRSVARQKLNGGSPRHTAKSLHCPAHYSVLQRLDPHTGLPS